jgi:hypothetical protein
MSVFLHRTSLLVIGLGVLCAAGAGCVVHQTQASAPLDAGSRWVVLPVMNFAETPQAGERAEAILETLLRTHGVTDLDHYPALKDDSGLPELDERRRYEKALDWARGQGFSYGVTGTVEEWRYRSGLDGEPAVGLSVQVIDLASGRVVWSATGARSGWGRESVSGTAHKLTNALLGDLRFARPAPAPPARSATLLH